MASSIKTLVSSNTATLVISGDFKFDLYQEFRDAFESLNPGSAIVIDLRHASSMDSTAMGMLLNMKQKLDKGDGEIRITNVPENLLKLFLISRFDKKFDIG